jgi:hypothetical protein
VVRRLPIQEHRADHFPEFGFRIEPAQPDAAKAVEVRLDHPVQHRLHEGVLAGEIVLQVAKPEAGFLGHPS